MIRLVIFFINIFIVSGCVHYSVEPYRNYLATFKGYSETDIIRNFGIPTKTYTTQNSLFLNYTKTSSGSATTKAGNSYYTTHHDYFCSTTFVLQSDKVVDYFFDGNSCGEYVVDEKIMNYMPVF